VDLCQLPTNFDYRAAAADDFSSPSGLSTRPIGAHCPMRSVNRLTVARDQRWHHPLMPDQVIRASGCVSTQGANAMPPDLRFSDSETDEALRLPSRRVIVALTALSLFMLLLASLSYGQGVAPPQRSSFAGAAGSIELVTGTVHRVNRFMASR
jgi:hypothetical protein